MLRLNAALLALTVSAAAISLPLLGQQPPAPVRPAPASTTPANRATPATPAAPKVTEEKPGLFARAKVTPEAAMATALTSVPGGRITKGELEEEDGRLIYSFDIKVAGRRGIEEVHVDALTGAVIKTEHEADDPAPAKKVPPRV